MYPVLFKIGNFEITSFGVLVAVGALMVAGALLTRAGAGSLAARDVRALDTVNITDVQSEQRVWVNRP